MQISWKGAGLLTLARSVTFQRAKSIGSFLWKWSTKSRVFEKTLPIFKFNLSYRNEVIEKRKVRLAKLIFHVFSTNVVVFNKAPRKSPARTNLFQKVKKEHFINHFLSPITYSNIIYHRVLLLNNVKAPRGGLHHILPATDASHTSRTLPIYDWRCIWFDVFDDVISRGLGQWPQNYLY